MFVLRTYWIYHGEYIYCRGTHGAWRDGVARICGTDVKFYKSPPTSKPMIMGHENIGYIAKAGSEFTRRKGFKEGDLVFLEHYVMCGKCEWCHKGEYRLCELTDWRANPD